MGTKNTQLSRQERKAKKRAAEDLIPDIPGREEVNHEKEASNNDTALEVQESNSNSSAIKKSAKRKRKRDEEEEKGRRYESDEQQGEERRHKNKKKRDGEKKSKSVKLIEEGETDAPAKEKQEDQIDSTKKKKRKEKERKVSSSSPNLKDDRDTSSTPAEELIKKSKKERKAELRAAKGLTTKEPSNRCPSTEKEDTAVDLNDSDGQRQIKKKERKEKKARTRKSHDDAEDHTQTRDGLPKTAAVAATSEKESVSSANDASKTTTASASRFIVFVGNLPYTATTASIMAHFSKLKPLAVRHLTKKDDPTRSRGTAFVEFANYDTHKTALKVMHHSTFDDGLSDPRKINVELTAGGGGNKEGRRNKIKLKNDKLNEQRIRRLQEEEKAKLDKASATPSALSVAESAIHPSRRKMISV